MALENLRGLIVTLIIIGLLLGVGFLLIREFADTMGDTSYDGSTLNETVTYVQLLDGNHHVAHNHTNMDCFHDFVLGKVFNGTGLVEIVSTNYTYEAATGRIWNLSALPAGIVANTYGSNISVNYAFEYSNSTGCAGMEETIKATEKIQEWLGIIAVLFIVGVLLFIVYQFAFPSVGGGKAGGGDKFKFKGFGGGGGDSGSAEI